MELWQKKVPVKGFTNLEDNEKDQLEFEHLKAKFDHIEDPVEQYMKRQEMQKIRRKLVEKGIELEMP